MEHRCGQHHRKIAAIALTAGLAALPLQATPAAHAANAYTVEPLGGTDTTPSLFNGAVCEIYQCVKVPTPATLDWTHSEGVFGENGSIAEGAASLNAALVDDPDEKLVFGFSQGAQVGGFWLRNYAPTSAVDPATTSFLFVGDPENTYGVPWAPRVPTDSGFAVTELWAQYDGWADWPDRFNLLAIANAVYGMLFVHPTVYDDINLAAEEAAGNIVTWHDDGVTYKMVADADVPLLDPLRNIGFGWLADALNDGMRASIEAAYDRPATQAEADARYGDPAADEVAATGPAVAAASVEPVDSQPAAQPANRDKDVTDDIADEDTDELDGTDAGDDADVSDDEGAAESVDDAAEILSDDQPVDAADAAGGIGDDGARTTESDENETGTGDAEDQDSDGDSESAGDNEGADD
ncbi:MAG: PE-PPE domain-containing protein [Actinomycetota bacterium]|nr:PE-PPE domain-containing protein [Actinomycetota bacterium]